MLDEKTILVTGGTGSFGRVFIKKLLQEHRCKKVIVFSRDEWKQWEMQENDPLFRSPNIRYFLGDVRDASRLERAFRGVDIVVHAAALKQVPAAEYNPSEFVMTNVMGANNVINAAINANVKTVIALSTDKAVNPVNLYGATKLCADKLFVAGNVYVGASQTPAFSVVRYGNVLGSRGSILERWQRLKKHGGKKLPVTHEEMTRFWITLDEAASFVIKAITLCRGGEIFVPKIPSMKIIDLAKMVAPEMEIELIGIREGEKLHELLINLEDGRHTIEFDDHYIITPEIYLKHPNKLKNFLNGRVGSPMKQGFTYASNENPHWIDSKTGSSKIKDYL